MTTKKIIISFFASILLCASLNAQSSVQKEADRLFNKFAYAKAIPQYEQMVVNSYNENHAYQRLAECYLLMRDFEKSIPYFKRFIEEADTPTNYYFKYAMALKSSGDEDSALKWLKKYKKFNKNDKRVKAFLKDGNLASVVFNSRERYDLEPVPFNTEYSEFGSFVHEGNLYFSASRKSQKNDELYGWNNEPWLDIFYVPEGNTMASPKRFGGEINSKFHESSLVFSTDYKNDTIVYFTRNNYFQKKEGFHTTQKEDKLIENQNNLKIYKGEKIDGEWKVTRNLKTNADHYSTGHPSVNTERTLLYFSSDRPGGYGGTDIYYAKIHPRGGIGQPINAGPIVNTAGNEMFPYVNNEGQLFFSSDGHLGFGQLDVFGTVADSTGQIKDVINLGKPLNSDKDDFGYYALENGIDGYVSSNRKGGKGGDDIYKFRFVPSLSVQGVVTDAINLKTLDSVQISLFNQATGELMSKTMTDANGKYQMLISRNVNYRIEAVRKTHPHKSVYFNTRTTGRAARLVRQDIELEPILDVKVLAGLKKIYYDFNKADIRPDAAIELDKVVKLMTETYPEMIIKLEAHTDPVGSHAYNDQLSERRAKSAYEYLLANGVPRNHILSYKGFGKRVPINECTSKQDCTPEELELNRRTEFPVVQIKSRTVTQSK
ncbi:OmpA family protein [Croceitalea sp. P059]|uniref:OmpA family protein n=1 Tax=Croceitalea sp. P059 TaxID=3075601 RepID=UPI00288615A0|nr:OmpA family protein [Croceitalea sp. P059]MDT0541074.1 OmpA family protein [Croceitalea sp. P059]